MRKQGISPNIALSLLAASSTACTTTDGDTCHFPFTYRSEVFHSCTDSRYDTFWCSTVPDYDSNSWGTCATDNCVLGKCTRLLGLTSIVLKRIMKFFLLLNFKIYLIENSCGILTYKPQITSHRPLSLCHRGTVLLW